MGPVLLAGFLLVRFGLLAMLDRKALACAAYFAPMQGSERIAYWIYQLTNVTILVLICYLPVQTQPRALLYLGSGLYAAGLLLLIASVVAFAKPQGDGLRYEGIYRWSRHPMYTAYFVLFMGCVALTQSAALFLVVLVFQGAAHFIILAEERWCLACFGEAYQQYMQKVRRYL